MKADYIDTHDIAAIKSYEFVATRSAVEIQLKIFVWMLIFDC